MLRGKGLEFSPQRECKHKASVAVSSCLQAALAERNDGSQRSEAKQKSSLPPNNPQPLRREKLLRFAQVKFGAIAPRVFKFNLRILLQSRLKIRQRLCFQDLVFASSNLTLLKLRAKFISANLTNENKIISFLAKVEMAPNLSRI